MKRKRKRNRNLGGSTASIDYGQCPFFGNEESVDAADAARYRYLTSGYCELSFFLRLCELPKVQWSAAIDEERGL